MHRSGIDVGDEMGSFWSRFGARKRSGGASASFQKPLISLSKTCVFEVRAPPGREEIGSERDEFRELVLELFLERFWVPKVSLLEWSWEPIW